MTVQATNQAPTTEAQVTAQAQAPTQTPPAAPPQDKKPDEMSAKFAALARKEKRMRDEMGRFTASRAEWVAREKSISDRESAWEQEFKTNPIAALKKRGITYEDISKAVLNDDKFEPSVEIKSVKDEIASLKKEAQEKETRAQEDARRQREQAEQEAIEAFKGGIATFIGENKEKFELVSIFDAGELVFQTVEEHYARTSKAGTPKVLSVDEACQMVETYLENEIERTAQASKKFQSKYGALKTKEEAPKKPAATTTTLSNQATSRASPSMLPASTENDRIKRALAALG